MILEVLGPGIVREVAMNLFNRLPDFPRSPHGLECRILKRLPLALVGVTVVPILIVVLSNWLPPVGTAEVVAKQLTLTEIWAWSLAITGWTAVFTVAIACAIVYVMKGPGYVADAYPLPDADEPARRVERRGTTLHA